MMTNSTTKVYDEALQERVRKYMKDTGLSQNKLAPRIGMSGASLSNYMNCKMDGSVEGIESRLREFLQQESEAAAGAGAGRSLQAGRDLQAHEHI